MYIQVQTPHRRTLWDTCTYRTGYWWNLGTPLCNLHLNHSSLSVRGIQDPPLTYLSGTGYCATQKGSDHIWCTGVVGRVLLWHIHCWSLDTHPAFLDRGGGRLYSRLQQKYGINALSCDFPHLSPTSVLSFAVRVDLGEVLRFVPGASSYPVCNTDSYPRHLPS